MRGKKRTKSRGDGGAHFMCVENNREREGKVLFVFLKKINKKTNYKKIKQSFGHAKRKGSSLF